MIQRLFQHGEWLSHRVQNYRKDLLTVVAGQGVQQLLAMVTALSLMRWLNIEQYAAYTLAMSAITIMMLVADLGFGNAVYGIVGNESQNLGKVAATIRSALQIRTWLFIPSILVGILFLFLLPHDQSFDRRGFIWAMFFMTLAVWFQGAGGLWSTVLLLEQKLVISQGLQSGLNAIRFLFYLTLHMLGWLQLETIMAAHAVILAINWLVVRWLSRLYLADKAVSSPRIIKEFIRLTAPKIPLMAYNSASSQIPILIGASSASTQTVAQVGALSRIYLIFSVFTAIYSTMVGPRIAQSKKEGLRKKIFLLLLGVSLLMGLIFIGSYFFPQPYLYLLGHRYHGASRAALSMVVATGCLGSLAGLLSFINDSRKWVFWRFTWLSIILGSLSQIAALSVFGVKTPEGLLSTGLALSFLALGINFYTCLLGLKQSQYEG